MAAAAFAANPYQICTAHLGTSGTDLSCTGSVAVVGDVILIFGDNNEKTIAVTFADGVDTYTSPVYTTHSYSGFAARQSYSTTTATSTGTRTFNMHHASNATYRQLTVVGIPGLLSATVDRTASNDSSLAGGSNGATGTAASVLTAATTHANEVVIGMFTSYTSTTTWTAGSGFTLASQNNGADSQCVVYKIVGITGPKTPSATLSTANQWLGRAVTFQQAPSYTAPGKPFFTGLFSVSPDTSSETIAILSDEHNLFDPAKSAGGQAGYPPLEAQIRSWNPSTIVVAGDLGATTAPRSQIYKGVLVNSLTSVSPGTVRVEIDTATLNGTTNASCPVCIFGDPNNTLPTVGNMVAVDTGANWEWLPITARDATHLTLTFAKSHTAPFKIQAHALAEYSDYFDAGKLFVALGNHDTQNTTDDCSAPAE